MLSGMDILRPWSIHLDLTINAVQSGPVEVTTFTTNRDFWAELGYSGTGFISGTEVNCTQTTVKFSCKYIEVPGCIRLYDYDYDQFASDLVITAYQRVVVKDIQGHRLSDFVGVERIRIIRALQDCLKYVKVDIF